jgi:LacI family transcriptional regulator
VSATTRERVLEVAHQIDYTPSAAARSLVRQRSQLIGVILNTGAAHPDLQHPFFQDVLVTLKNTVGRSGYDLLLFATEQPGTDVEYHSHAKRIRHRGVDGVVLMGIDARDPELGKIAALGIPTVAIDTELRGPRAAAVGSDNVLGARLAVRHLHELGHARIATISGPTDTTPGADRLLGFRQELEELGLPAEARYLLDGDFYAESGYAAMKVLLALTDPPTAVFAAADLMAVGAIRAIQDAGLRCPDDVAVVGFDDIQLASLLLPAVTTIRQDKGLIGSAAAEALVAMIDDPTLRPAPTTLPVELVVRDSCGPPPA